MDTIIDTLSNIIKNINSVLWGIGTILLIFGTGIFFTIRLKFIQFRHPVKILKCTLFNKDEDKNKRDHKSVSRFQALSTALAASMGTGNIVGVAAAITVGGSGAIFWMWISALFGMATAYAENILGVKYKNITPSSRTKGPMLYLEHGLKCKPLAVIFAIACVLASFGIGNMTQSNAISAAADVLHISPALAGIITLILTAMIIMRKNNAIAKATEKIIPAISLFYIIGAVIVLVIFRNEIMGAFSLIFTSAFGLNQAIGGITGAILKKAITIGLQRGIFSNEAGMGSSVLIHTAADCDEPAIMGMWAILEVFIDTILCCTLTALVIICTGAYQSGGEGIEIVISAFERGLGGFAGIFIAISTIIFAFATLLGWCYYGETCIKYLSAKSYPTYVYKIFFLAAIYFGAVSNLTLVWELSDTFNVLMLVPNLIGILLLSSQIVKCNNDYFGGK